MQIQWTIRWSFSARADDIALLSNSSEELQQMLDIQYKSKETPQLIGLFSPNLVITNFMQCFLYVPIG